MSCRRAFEMDLPGFLARARAAEFRDFREHYPLCPECAAEVRAWTELDVQLRGTDAHPAPELLLRFEADAGALGAEQRASVSAHLGECVSCRDELRALRAFDRAGVALAPEPAGLPVLARVLGGLRWLIWQPAVAYALVLILLIPVVLARWPAGERPVPEPTAEAPARKPAPAEEAQARFAQEPQQFALAEEAQARFAKEQLLKLEISAGSDEGASQFEAPAVRALASPAAAEPPPLQVEPDLEAHAEPAYPPGPESVARKRVQLAESRYFDQATEPALALTSLAEALAGSTIDAVRVGETVRIELRLADLEPIETIEVRVLHPDGRRELRETLHLDDVEELVVVDLPGAWATPGSYRIEVRPLGDHPGAVPARVLNLRAVVPPPDAQ